MKPARATRRAPAAVSAFLLAVLSGSLAFEKDKFPYATIGEACAPWDGPAVELHLSSRPLKCAPGEAPGDVIELTISFWRDLPLHKDQTFSLDAKSGWGGASYCKGAQLPCERASSGNIHIQSITAGKGADGTYELMFPKLGRVDGSFHAAPCKRYGACR